MAKAGLLSSRLLLLRLRGLGFGDETERLLSWRSCGVLEKA